MMSAQAAVKVWKKAFVFTAIVGATVWGQTIPNPPNPLTVEGGTVAQASSSTPLFFDNFEYAVPRTDNDVSGLFRQHGYTGVRQGLTTGGYLYTQRDAARASNVLVMESLPSANPPPSGWPYGQTDYWLQLWGNAGQVPIPPNVWFQFWTYATPESQFGPRDKVIYVCRTSYPCTTGNWTWLFQWGSQGYEYAQDPYQLPAANRFLALQTISADNRNAPQYPDVKEGLYQNTSKANLVGGRWYQVRLHMDISGPQGIWQAWIRQQGQTAWTNIADWQGGVTPNFTWPIPPEERTGHFVLRAPTTVNGQRGDSKTFWDDFTIGRSEAELPN